MPVTAFELVTPKLDEYGSISVPVIASIYQPFARYRLSKDLWFLRRARVMSNMYFCETKQPFRNKSSHIHTIVPAKNIQGPMMCSDALFLYYSLRLVIFVAFPKHFFNKVQDEKLKSQTGPNNKSLFKQALFPFRL